MGAAPHRNQKLTVGLAIGAVFGAVVATIFILDVTLSFGNQSPIAGDPILFNIIATRILDGSVPYIETPVEHLPGALIPMLAVRVTSSITGTSFEALWPLFMGFFFVVSVRIADRFPTPYSAGRRYLALSLPLLPLVLFRVEPWLMMWVVASLGYALRSAWPRNITATLIATMSKGWPIVLLILPYRLGQKRLAVIFGALTAAALGWIFLLPGFQEGRSFVGIHTETIIGNLVMLFRSLNGTDLQLANSAGAAYVDVGSWAVVVNAVIGLPFIAVATVALFRHHTTSELISSIGLGVTGIVIASPLLSSQFLFWMVPFVVFLAINRRTLYLFTSLATLLTIIFWSPSDPTWSLLVLSRNGLLLALAVLWALDSLRSLRVPSESQDVS